MRICFQFTHSWIAAMVEDISFDFLHLDIFFSLLSFFFFVLDVVLDTLAVVSFYRDEEYVFMGLLIFLLIGSSVLQQIFSWVWYSEPSETKIETFIERHRLLGLIHILQLGIFLRSAGVVEISIQACSSKSSSKKGISVYRSHDLSTLRLFEAFSENAPQVVLMIINILQMEELHIFPVVKLAVSLCALSVTVLFYHRNMRAFIPEKFRMKFGSSVMYFLWNLLLIGPRVACLSLFASVLPFYIAAHFLFLWMLLVFWAWWQKTDFMDSTAAEWLYRATVGIIWYFSWFNVADGSTKSKAIFYHVDMGMDMVLLLGLWWWKRSVESAHLGPLPVSPQAVIVTVTLVYITGLVLKAVYYWKLHPNKTDLQIDVDYEKTMKDPEVPLKLIASNDLLETDSIEMSEPEPKHALSAASQETFSGIHKRMRNMAVHFYC